MQQEGDYYDVDDYLEIGDEMSTPEQRDCEVLEIENVLKEINSLIKEVAEQVNFSEDNTLELLIHFNWNKEDLEQKYFSNEQKILDDLRIRGIFNDHSKVLISDKKINCQVCLDFGKMIQLGCGHQFCEECIRGTIHQRVTKDRFLNVRCLQVGCLYRMPFSLLQRFVDINDFQQTLCKRFVDCSRYLAYCPGINCNKIIKPFNSTIKEVTCSCGTKFCFSCKEDLHPPAPCDIVKKWITEVKKDEANVRWITINTKICPFCKKPVERSEGCNYMLCKPPGGCGKAFCYICSNPWEPDHKDHFKCNKYVAPQNNIEKEMEVLQRYNFYYERYLNSQAAKEKALTRLKRVEEYYIKDIYNIYQFTYQDAQFLKSALQELVDSRVVLKWSYCIGYYISKNNADSAKLFDHYQEQFELSCETLAINLIKLFDTIDAIKANESIKLQKTLHEWKQEFVKSKEIIQNSFQKCFSIRRNLEKAIQEGQIQM